MKPTLRIFILTLSAIAAVSIFWNLWMRTVASPTELRIHVSFLAFGYTLFIGTAIQEVSRMLTHHSTPKFKSLTTFRLIANCAATTGYVFGILWAIHFHKYGALHRPVLITDTIVIGFAWFIVTRLLRNYPTKYWDIALGLGTLISWYLATQR